MSERKRIQEAREQSMKLELTQRPEMQLSQECALGQLTTYIPITTLQIGLDKLKSKGIEYGIYIGTGPATGEYAIVNGKVDAFKIKQHSCSDGCNCQRLLYKIHKNGKGIKILADALKEAIDFKELPRIVAYNTTKRARVRQMDLANDNLEELLEFELTR